MKDLPLLKKGSRKKEVILLQQLLKNKGFFSYKIIQIYGPKTFEAVCNFQKSIGLEADGIVGNMTWKALHDMPIKKYSESVLNFHNYFLNDDEYVKEIVEKDQLYLHHTASSHNPERVVDVWEKDKYSNGKRKLNRISTAFVIGGLSTRNNETKYDGMILRCFNEKYWGYHTGWLGKTSDARSIGIEICNYGYLTINRNGQFVNYVGGIVPEDMVCDLGFNFRNHQYYHKYTDKQLESTRKLLLDLSDRFEIKIEKNIYNLEWFNYQPNKIKTYSGIVTHTQVRKDKTDLSPQPNLIQMLNSL